MNRIKHLLKDLAILIRANLWLIPVIAALVAAVFYFVAPPPPMSATMATGAEGGGYAVFAGKLREKLKEQGFELKLVPSAGSRDNLERLLGTGEVDIALVQSGQERQLEAGQARQLQTLGAVYQEPLWLFHRNNVHIDQLSDLLHLRLAIGSDGSGTRAATEAILQANDIAPGHYPITWEARGGNAVVDDLLAGKLDAAFIVGPAENPAIQKLADNDQLRLVNFRRSAAYEARLPFLKRVEVGEGLLNLPRNVPERNISTLSPVATLVINERFHPALIPLVLEAAREVMKDGSLLDKPGAFPSAEPAHPAPARGRRALLQERPAAAAALPAVPHRLPGGPLHHPADPVHRHPHPADEVHRPAVSLAHPRAHLPLVPLHPRHRPQARQRYRRRATEKRDRAAGETGERAEHRGGAALLLPRAVRAAPAPELRDQAPARSAGTPGDAGRSRQPRVNWPIRGRASGVSRSVAETCAAPPIT